MNKAFVLAVLLILALSPNSLERASSSDGVGAWMPWILAFSLVTAAASLAALSLLGTQRAVRALRWWFMAPLALLLLSVAFSSGGGAAFLLFVLPGYSVWCGIGALQALVLQPRPDLAAVLINGSIALVACIPFVLIETGVVRLHI